MERSYYYFVASLPILYFGESPPFSVDNFINHAESLLHKNDFARLSLALKGQPSSLQEAKGVFALWMDFNHDLRNELAWARAHQLKKDPYEHLRSQRYANPAMIEVVAQANKAKDPLEATRILDRFRWDYLDEITLQHHYNFANVLAYGLKLQILERYQEIESDKGLEKFNGYKEFKRVKEIIGIN